MMLRRPWIWIWNASEFTGIGLGRFAPFVFHKMLGSSSYHRVDE